MGKMSLGLEDRSARLLSGRDVWPEIKALLFGYNDVQAAIAFVGADADQYLPLRGPATIVVNAGEEALRNGWTDPSVLLRWTRRGVRVHTLSTLHAKVLFAQGNPPFVLVGSADVLSTSGRALEEAVLVADEKDTVDEVRRAVDRWRRLAGEPLTDAWLQAAALRYRPPGVRTATAPVDTPPAPALAEATVPEVGVREASVPEVGVPEATGSDGSAPDATTPGTASEPEPVEPLSPPDQVFALEPASPEVSAPPPASQPEPASPKVPAPPDVAEPADVSAGETSPDATAEGSPADAAAGDLTLAEPVADEVAAPTAAAPRTAEPAPTESPAPSGAPEPGAPQAGAPQPDDAAPSSPAMPAVWPRPKFIYLATLTRDGRASESAAELLETLRAEHRVPAGTASEAQLDVEMFWWDAATRSAAKSTSYREGWHIVPISVPASGRPAVLSPVHSPGRVLHSFTEYVGGPARTYYYLLIHQQYTPTTFRKLREALTAVGEKPSYDHAYMMQHKVEAILDLWPTIPYTG